MQTSVRVASAFSVDIRRKDFALPDGQLVPVLDHVSFELTPGTSTCLIGSSGCGKTTTLRILMGLDHDFDGEIGPAFRASRLAVVFQEPRLLPWRTVAHNVALALPDVRPDSEIVTRALTDVGVADLATRYPAELSLGQARRVALARAFAVEPDLLLLDEPFVSLDEATAQRLRGLLTSLCERHPVTVLMVTHNVREAVQLADRLILLSMRPSHVADTAEIGLPRRARTPEAIDAVVADLARRHPQLVVV